MNNTWASTLPGTLNSVILQQLLQSWGSHIPFSYRWAVIFFNQAEWCQTAIQQWKLTATYVLLHLHLWAVTSYLFTSQPCHCQPQERMEDGISSMRSLLHTAGSYLFRGLTMHSFLKYSVPQALWPSMSDVEQTRLWDENSVTVIACQSNASHSKHGMVNVSQLSMFHSNIPVIRSKVMEPDEGSTSLRQRLK